MNVLLTSELEEFVQEKVNKLRAEIAIGIQQGDRGEVFDGEDVVRELLEEIDRAEQAQQ